MANSNFVFRVNVAGKNPIVAGDKRLTLRNIIRFFTGLLNGQRLSVGSATVVAEHTAVAASGTLTLSSASGTVGGSINGTSVTRAASGGDTATAAALAADFNAAAAIVSGHVTATANAGVITFTSKFPGVAGNAVTLAASGTGVTASGARLTGGSSTSSTFTF